MDRVKADVLASFVVFLVALPLCMGIAMASGAPPIAGIVSGVIGGVVVAALGGNSMQVSGPANGLIVVVAMILQQWGADVLGVVVLAAGAIQLAAGCCRLGQIFRMIPPATIQGLMTGFAVIIFASQFHVMLDDPVPGSTLENLARIPQAIIDSAIQPDGAHRAAILGVATIVVLMAWKRVAPGRLALLPPSLVAVAAATAIGAIGSLPVARVDLPETLDGAIRWLDLQTLPRLLEWPVLQLALMIAFLASTETLLSATAVDRLHQGPRTNYNRELAAQGIGNMLCGILGAIPLTGVVIRSAANVAAGARTRLSSVLHGVWLLVLVVLAPRVLQMIPTASLAAVLVVAVTKLVDVRQLRQMWRQDPREVAIYGATAAGVIFWGVLPGVCVGLLLALCRLLHSLAQLEIRREDNDAEKTTVLYLTGRATLLSAAKLAKALDGVSPDTQLHVCCQRLELLDHTCLELLLTWERQHRHRGGVLVLDWDEVKQKYAHRAICRAEPTATAASAKRLHRSRADTSGWQVIWNASSRA